VPRIRRRPPQQSHTSTSNRTPAGATAPRASVAGRPPPCPPLRLVEGKTVDLEFDVQQRDKYGRLLAYVRTKDDTLVNTELVFRGFAGAATYPPNVRCADYFRTLERSTREQKRGLWGDPTATQAYAALDGTVEAQGLTSAPYRADHTSYGVPSSSNGDSASSKNGPVKVRGYSRSDGTYVQPHTRSAPTRRR
jgi:hypothetical protein